MVIAAGGRLEGHAGRGGASPAWPKRLVRPLDRDAHAIVSTTFIDHVLLDVRVTTRAASAATPPRTRRRSCTRCRGSRRASGMRGRSRRECGRRPPRPRRTRPSRARCKDDAVEQAPPDLGQRDAQRICQPLAPSVSAASSSSLPCACMTGSTSRATKGKVTNVVASTMPGTAKMMWMSCVRRATARASPRAPNSSTKISPEMTGETLNGRSISVSSRLLPAETGTWR